MKKRILSLALALALALSFAPSAAPTAAAAEKSIWDKVNDGDLLYGIVDFPNVTDETREINGLIPEQDIYLASALGTKAYRFTRSISEVLKNPDEFYPDRYANMKKYINGLQAEGIEVIGSSIYCFSEIDNGYHNIGRYVPSRDLTEGSAYMRFLDAYYRSAKTMVAGFPEVSLWWFAYGTNAINCLETGEEYSISERAEISVDMMYMATKAIREVNPNAVSIMDGPDGGLEIGDINASYTVIMLQLIYENIKNGTSVSGSTDTDDYFDCLSWNPYYATMDGLNWITRVPDDEYIARNNAAFEVAKQYGDGHKKVFFTEVGSTDEGNPDAKKQMVEFYQKLFECVEQMDYVANVCVFEMYDNPAATWGPMPGSTMFGLFSSPAEGLVPKESAFAIQNIFGGTGDLLKYSLTQSTYSFPYKHEAQWRPYNHNDLLHNGVSATAALYAGKLIVQCDSTILESDYSFSVLSHDLYRYDKGDPRITVSGNIITLDITDLERAAESIGFTIWDEDVNSGIEGVWLDVAYDGTETAELLPYLRVAASNALLPDSQADKFNEQITREDFDAFYVPLFERKYGYDYDYSAELDAAYSAFIASGGITRGDCVKAAVRQFEQWSGETSPHIPTSWAESGVASALDAGLIPLQLQNSYAQSMTRAEFCALAVALYEKVKGEITERKTFNDTIDINVEKMAAIGVVSGTDTTRGLFSPDMPLTREQAATLLVHLADAMGKPLPKQESEAIDKDSFSSWAAEAIGQMQAAGIMSSTSTTSNVFSPKVPYSREQSILTILKLYDMAK